MSRPGARNGRSLPEHIRQDRLERYLAGEPILRIAQDHGVSDSAIIALVHRHAPWALGERTRGGGPRQWPPE